MFISRLYHLARYHQCRQFIHRFLSKVFSPIKPYLPRKHYEGRVPIRTPSVLVLNRLKESTSFFGQRRLLNLPLPTLSSPTEWKIPAITQSPLLWQFNLHYHEYLNSEDYRPSGKAWEVIRSWIDAHPLTPAHTRMAWHPFTLSKRIPVWMLLWVQNPPEANLATKIKTSLLQQISWLESNLEKDIGGNHLWENARSLILAGCFFSGPQADRWRLKGQTLLDDCIFTQLLPWGEHFERSPSYHYELAQGLEELADWLKWVDPTTAGKYEATAIKMQNFSKSIAHPNKFLPLFGDSWTQEIETPLPEDRSEWIGDYYVHRQNNHFLIFDAGNLGPDELPAHSHCDLLGFELSAFGKKLFVDSGTFCYQGEKRNSYRGTNAHNVLMVDNEEIADIWSSFRMGRRGRVTEKKHGKTTEGMWIWAKHDAYRHLGISDLYRIWFLANEGGPWFSFHVLNTTKQKHELTEFCHLHPEIQTNPSQTGILLNYEKHCLLWEPLNGNRQSSIKQSSYSADFFVEQPNQTLVLSKTLTTPHEIVGWALSFTQSPCVPEVTWDSKTLLLTWNSNGTPKSTQLSLP